jgi:glycosyltransferase involved in cell wall biosynthesis
MVEFLAIRKFDMTDHDMVPLENGISVSAEQGRENSAVNDGIVIVRNYHNCPSGQNKLGVVIPIYNGETCLNRVFQNITALPSTDTELIIVDDGSTDKTWSLLQAALDLNAPVTLIHRNENLGVASARNLAISKSRAEFLWLVDADDVWPSGAVKTIHRVLRGINNSDRRVDIVFARAVRMIENSRRTGAVSSPPELGILEPETLIRSFLHGDIQGHLWNKVIRRSLFKEIPFPQLGSKSDAVGMISLLEEASCGLSISDVIYEYRFHNGSIATSSPSPWDLISVLKAATRVAERFDMRAELKDFRTFGFAVPVLTEIWRKDSLTLDDVMVEKIARSLISIKISARSSSRHTPMLSLFCVTAKIAPGLARRVYRLVRRREWQLS